VTRDARVDDASVAAERWNPDLEVLDEVDAFLDGTFPERAGSRASRLPGWAWVSALSHGGTEVLAALSDPPDPPVGAWGRAIGFLADEVLDLAGREDAELRDLQEGVLVRAELHFLDQAARGWAPRPEQFTAEVLAQLEHRRRAGPRTTT